MKLTVSQTINIKFTIANLGYGVMIGIIIYKTGLNQIVKNN